MADDTERQVPWMSYTITNFNPNHRIRFFSCSQPMYFLFDLSTAVPDDSLYLAPKLRQPITIQWEDTAGHTVSGNAAPTGDVHFSFHEFGAINLQRASTRSILRTAVTGRPESGFVARLIFNSVSLFREASADDINSLANRYTPIPISGFWGMYPISLDIYQVDADTEWVMPEFANIMQVHVCVKPNRKRSVYHFLTWQNSKLERDTAELMILY